MHFLAGLLLLLANPADIAVTLPLSKSASVDPGPSAMNRIAIDLTRHGQIRAGGKQRSLAELLAWFAIEAFPRPQTNKNAPRVLLRVDRAAPWQHVLQVVSVLERSGIKQIEFGVRLRADQRDSARRAFQVGVPRDPALPSPEGYFAVRLHTRSLKKMMPVESPRAAKNIVRDQLSLIAEREVTARWGPVGKRQSVRLPLNVRAVWNERTTYSHRLLDSWTGKSAVNRATRLTLSLGAKTRVILRVSEKVPARYVIAQMALLRSNGWQEIWFFDRITHTSMTRLAANAMAYPKTNRMRGGNDGLSGTAMPNSDVGERLRSKEIR